MKCFTPTEEWLYRHILESAHVAVIYADTTGTIRLWNKGTEEIFGAAHSYFAHNVFAPFAPGMKTLADAQSRPNFFSVLGGFDSD